MDLWIFHFFQLMKYLEREGRKKAKSGIYDNKWREKAFGNIEFITVFLFCKKIIELKPYFFLELAVSPFSKDNISDFLILAIIPAGILTPFLQEALYYGNNIQYSVFTTGKSFIGPINFQYA